jgi:pimeloyl-ACP methyl ester carboxylesterase
MTDAQIHRNRFLSRAVLVPIALVGVAIVLWFGAATLVTYHILHPPFLDGSYGDIIFGSEKERAGVELQTDPMACCQAAFDNLRISADGVSVDAWFVPATLDSAILLVPPSGASKRAMLPYLKFLHSVGLPVLLIDSTDLARGRAGWGWSARGIVKGAVEVLRQKGFANIAALGVSEGAATALIVQGEHPDTFGAIIADSSFDDLGATLRRYPSLGGLNPAFLQTILWEVGFALGHSPDDISPKRSASHLGKCALLLVQNTKDPLIPESDAGAIVAARADSSSRIFLVESAGHGDAIYVNPQGYQKAVLDFLAHNLPGAASTASP